MRAGVKDWLDLLSCYRRITAVGAVPDWPTVAEAHDAVHFTMNAAIALQGTSYRLTDGSQTVPMYVDVESTVWLRWAFIAVVPIADTTADRAGPPARRWLGHRVSTADDISDPGGGGGFRTSYFRPEKVAARRSCGGRWVIGRMASTPWARRDRGHRVPYRR